MNETIGAILIVFGLVIMIIIVILGWILLLWECFASEDYLFFAFVLGAGIFIIGIPILYL